MNEFQAVAATLTSLKTAGDMLKSIIDLKGAIQEQGKVFELQRVIISAHQSALSAQEAQMALLEKIRGLEKQISDFETWEGEKTRYKLMDVGGTSGSVLVYALKEEAEGAEPFHLLCAKCFQHRIKSILQATQRLEMRRRVHYCPECKSEFAFGHVPIPVRQDGGRPRNPFDRS